MKPSSFPAIPTIALAPNARGALWMLASAVCFTAMAISIKLLEAGDYPASQMVFARCGAGFLAMLPLVLTAAPGALKAARPGAVVARSAISTLGFFTGIYSIANLPLADAQSISFSRVLFVTLFAVWLLRERVGWRRWAAVGVGFFGVLLMVRPEAGAFNLAALAALASAVFFGLTIVLTKSLTRDHSVLALVFYTNAFTTLAGLPFAFGGWVTPSLPDLGLFLMLGLTGLGAQSCYVRGLSHGEASLVSLVDYTRLPMAVVAGFLLFQEAPDGLAIAGAAVIVASTIYITWRESQLKTSKAVPVEG